MLQLSEPEIHHAITLLKNIARTRPGQLAGSAGSALQAMASPLALTVRIEIRGLDPEIVETGAPASVERIMRVIRDYNLGDLKSDRRFPDFLSITTDDDRQVAVSVIKNLGNPVALVMALSDFGRESKFPLEESVYLVSSQLGARIHSILSPGSRNAMEIMARRLLKETEQIGAVGISIASIGEKDDWMTISKSGKEILYRQIVEVIPVNIETLKSGDTLDKSMAETFWPEIKTEQAVWVIDLPGYVVSLALSDKKSITKETKEKIKSAVEKLAVADAEYIANSFEKLKSDFKKLVKSERATAIAETAVTVNHEINNPLTAILGNTQLLLMNEKELSKETVAKLKTIERSAIQIRETTGKLMSIIEPVRTPYASGLNMIDIESSKKKEK